MSKRAQEQHLGQEWAGRCCERRGCGKNTTSGFWECLQDDVFATATAKAGAKTDVKMGEEPDVTEALRGDEGGGPSNVRDKRRPADMDAGADVGEQDMCVNSISNLNGLHNQNAASLPEGGAPRTLRGRGMLLPPVDWNVDWNVECRI